ncbi:MAG TPA: ABC transporter permease subunit [Candidatus Eisenbergiella merdipullorum]|uniref:ABC transporter permease subunit n=1 Tax=Candidatus Eisenbergiella merdipullorum TaxID=2838553 RepID=A0A9D2L154_9FIRM|nr:ABC transporter permease subunit [Candidatus Eisenbergiella merdipullorum]
MKKLAKDIRKNWVLYAFLIPALSYIILFCYAPMYGIQIAFKDFKISSGIAGSEWVGFKWFERFFSSPRSWTMIKNTLRISLYELLLGFPLPIILALILHNIRNQNWKRFAQTITYLPYFISTVVLVSMLSLFLSPRSGIINTIFKIFGGSGDVYFMGKANYFPHVYVLSSIWQNTGWNSIMYLAALSSVDPTLHEAAEIDGANRFRRVLHVDLPCIVPTIIIMLILKSGTIMSVGYEKAFLMQNNLNLATSEIISTYAYKIGLEQQMYSLSAAVSLFNNIINFLILTFVNKMSKKVSDTSLW